MVPQMWLYIMCVSAIFAGTVLAKDRFEYIDGLHSKDGSLSLQVRLGSMCSPDATLHFQELEAYMNSVQPNVSAEEKKVYQVTFKMMVFTGMYVLY